MADHLRAAAGTRRRSPSLASGPDRVPTIDVEDAVRTHEIVHAAELSAREGRPVKPSLPR